MFINIFFTIKSQDCLALCVLYVHSFKFKEYLHTIFLKFQSGTSTLVILPSILLANFSDFMTWKFSDLDIRKFDGLAICEFENLKTSVWELGDLEIRKPICDG